MRILSVADASELITLPTTTIFPSGWMATERPTDPVSSAPGIAGLVTTPPLPNDPSSAPELVNLATSRVAPDWTPDWPTATTLPSLCTAVPNSRALAAVGGDGRSRRRGRLRRGSLDRTAVRGGGGCGQDLPPRPAGAARVGRAELAQRGRRTREHEPRAGYGPSAGGRRSQASVVRAACRATGRCAATRRATRRAPTGSGANERRRACGWRRRGQRERRGRVGQGRSGSDTFSRKPSGPDRGFGRKEWSGSDTFRPGRRENPGTNPGTNPGAQRAHGKEPQNPRTKRTPPSPPPNGE